MSDSLSPAQINIEGLLAGYVRMAALGRTSRRRIMAGIAITIALPLFFAGGEPYADGNEGTVTIDMADRQSVIHYMDVEVKATAVDIPAAYLRRYEIECAAMGAKLAGTWVFNPPRTIPGRRAPFRQLWVCFGNRFIEASPVNFSEPFCHLSGREFMGTAGNVITCGPRQQST